MQSNAAAAPGIGSMLIPMVLVFVLFYFLLIRPQTKRMKEHEAMQSGVQRGDKVITNGGIVGKVSKASDEDLVITTAPDNIKITVRRSMIAVVVNPQPANDQGKKDKKK